MIKMFSLTAIASMLLMGGQVVRADEGGVPLHGFADVGGGYSTSKTPADMKVKNFYAGVIDLYLTPEFSDNVKSLIEIALETNKDTQQYALDVERLQIGYVFGDYLTLNAGRFHTPYGYWNTAFHHGAQMQTTIYRPRFLDFEDGGGILPAHSVGLWGSGSARLGAGRFLYDLYASNGSRLTDGFSGATGGTNGPSVLDYQAKRADKPQPSFGGRFAYAFGGNLDGLTVGTHAFQYRVNYNTDTGTTSDTNADQSYMVNMVGGYVVYDENKIEFASEFYHFIDKNLRDQGAKNITSNAGYAMLGYAVSPKWKPYYRFESTKLAQQDGYFAGQEHGVSYIRHLAGLRYDVNPRTSLKAEVIHNDFKDRKETDGKSGIFNIYQMQYAIRF